MLATPSKRLVLAALVAVFAIASLAGPALADDALYDPDYARSIAPWRGPIGAATNWGADLPGEFNPALGYYYSVGYWGYGTAGGFHYWDFGGPHRPPLRALHGNWWWQSGMHPYDLYETVISMRNAAERREMLREDQMMEDLPPAPDGARIERDSSLLVVKVPAAARVYINDQPTQSTGVERRFAPRGLEPSTPYIYRVRVELRRQGELVSETKVVRLGTGNRAELDFSHVDQQPVVAQAADSVR